MKNLASKIRHARLRKLPVLLALIAALVVPTAISTYAQENNEAPVEIPIANVDENGNLQNELPVTTEIPTPSPEDIEAPVVPEEQEIVEPPVVEIDTPTENEDPVAPEDTPQDALDRYMAFAIAEHPGVEVTGVKFVWKQGVKSAKITFADGYKVFIGVSDGSTLKVTDENDHVKKCQKRMLGSRKWNRWYKSYSSYYQWWLSQQNQDDNTEETDDNSEEQAEVQGATTESNRSWRSGVNENKNKKSDNYRRSHNRD